MSSDLAFGLFGRRQRLRLPNLTDPSLARVVYNIDQLRCCDHCAVAEK